MGLKSAIQSNREQRLVEKQSLEKFPGTAARLCLKDGSDSREGRQRGAPLLHKSEENGHEDLNADCGCNHGRRDFLAEMQRCRADQQIFERKMDFYAKHFQ